MKLKSTAVLWTPASAVMAWRKPIVDIEHQIPLPGEQEAHQPVRILGQDAKTTSMHVEHYWPRRCMLGGVVDV